MSQITILSLISAAGFFIASALSLRNHLLANKKSNFWLWVSASMAFIGASRLINFAASRNPLWEDIIISLLIAGAVMLIAALFDFDKEENLCMNNGSSTQTGQTKELRKRKRG